jgi:hypothetical protein
VLLSGSPPSGGVRSRKRRLLLRPGRAAHERGQPGDRRNAANGLIEGTTLGSVTTSQSVTPFSELQILEASANGNSLLGATFARDDAKTLS